MAFQFKYKKPDPKRVDQKINERSGSYDSYTKPQYSTWRPKEGKNKIRIIPCPKTLETDEDYGKTISIHYDIGPDGNAYLSLKEMLKKPDPVAEERNRLSREGNEEAAKKLRPGKRVLLWMIDRKEEEKGPQIFSAALSLHQDILKVSKDEGGGLLHHYDPEEGYDVIIERVGTGKTNTEYTPMIARKSTPLSDDEDKATEWLKYVTENPLDETLQYYDYEHIEEVFAGGKTSKVGAKKKSGDDDEDEEPKTRSASKSRVRFDDDEEERPAKKSRDDDEDEKPVKKKPRDDDEDERPAKKSKPADDDEDERPVKKSKPAEDDEDERPTKKKPRDDDEDERPAKKKAVEDDEDERPAKKSKPVDDDEDERPAKKKPVEDDDEDERPAKKRPVEDDDEDERPAKKKKPVEDDDEDERPAKKKPRRDDDD